MTEDDWREAMAEIANKNELVESLSAQVAEGTDGMIRMTALHRSLMAEADRRYDELFAQVAELKKDAERLDAFEKEWMLISWSLGGGCEVIIPTVKSGVMGRNENPLGSLRFKGKNLRAAIDAAKESGSGL